MSRNVSRDFLDGYLDRLEASVTAAEPGIRALMPEAGRFERLRREARSLAERFPAPDERPPLFGLVAGVKDIFRVDGLPTTAGSRLPPVELAGPEADSVTALKAAGSLILGKTVSTEFAYFAPGPTRNPRQREHTPGGSSSGSAAAVAAGYCPLALGTQTYGSVSRPAAYCGVVGFKPSYDRISRQGVIPLSPSFDHVGIFAPDVARTALAASVLCSDWRPLAAGSRPVLAVPVGAYLEQASTVAREAFLATRRRLEGAGFRVLDLPALDDFAAIRERHETVVAAEAAEVHERWYARFADLYHPKLRELIEQGKRVGHAALDSGRAGRSALRQRLQALMEERGVDVWISPAATGPAPRGLASTGDPCMNVPWTHAGLPTLAIPSAVTGDGLPLGLQLAAGWWNDELLLDWGAEIEASLRST